MVFQDSTNLNNVTKYIVDPTGDTPYTTIQSALDAANAAGGAIIYLRQGTYSENLILYDNTQIIGTLGLSDAGSGAQINGTHIPPSSGSFVFRNVKLASGLDIFHSSAAGTSHLIVADCAVQVVNGYLFNLVNWTAAGILEMWDVNEGFGTDDGCVHNTGGATVLCYSGSFGIGAGNTMIVSGPMYTDGAEFFVPIDFQTGAQPELYSSLFTRTLTFSNNSTGYISNSLITTGASAAITHNSSGTLDLSDVTINSSNNPAITGVGAGTINVGSITFLNNANFSASLTLSRKEFVTGTTKSLTFDTDDPNAGVTLSGTSLIADGLNSDIDIAITPKGVGEVDITRVDIDGGTIDGTTIGSATPAAGTFNTLADTSRTQNAIGIYGASGALSEIGPLTNGQLAIGSTGNPPVATTLTAGGGINVVNGAGSITISATGSGMPWTEVTGTSQTMAINNAYIANNAALVTLTLPATAAIGDIVQIIGKGAGGYKIAQNAGQTIYFGNQTSTTGVGGSVDSTHQRDAIELVCVTANNDWGVTSSIGNFSIT